jgi:HAMP domain-containing protein
MTITETVLIILLVVNVIMLSMSMSIYRDNHTIKLLIGQMHSALGNVINRIHAQEVYLQKLGTAFTEFTELMERIADRIELVESSRNFNTGMYRTIDGRYTASTLEKLIEKIKKDGTERDYLSDEELEGLRQLFEENDEEDDDNEFNPEEGKF